MLDLKQYDVEVWKKNHQKSLTAPIITNISSGKYDYISKMLLTSPVIDGRKRIVWLVLAPYAINVMKLSEEDAITMIDRYMKKAEGESPTTNDFDVTYHVERAIMNGLMPPLLETLQTSYPDLYELIESVITTRC